MALGAGLRWCHSFNSRTPGGVRPLSVAFTRSANTFQFTHPGRGATSNSGWMATRRFLFQFTHPGRGATIRGSSRIITPTIQFQFTHPGRGATSQQRGGRCCASCFNSRTPGGVRPTQEETRGERQQSFNSRTPGGVRPLPYPADGPDSIVSIHAPREGCDPKAQETAVYATVSIHAPREGCDCCRDSAILRALVSIHAPREGCDQITLYSVPMVLRFNSRTPGGVRRP